MFPGRPKWPAITLRRTSSREIDIAVERGKLDDVVLGYDTLDGYLGDNSHYGAIVGRYANRIGGARFALDGRTYELAANNGPSSLHGGRKGFDRAVWHAEPFERDGTAGVVLTHARPDGDEGFPGALSVSVTYAFNDRGELAIDYRATTDKATVLNLTNHSYFNLGGDGSGDVLGHRLTLNADRYTPVDKDLIPVGELASVAGTPLDFRAATAIGARIADPGLRPATGYDHNYVINRADASEVLAARVEDPKSGRVLEVFTTEPGVQLYTANHLDGSRIGRATSTTNTARSVSKRSTIPIRPTSRRFRPRRCGLARPSSRERYTPSACINQPRCQMALVVGRWRRIERA